MHSLPDPPDVAALPESIRLLQSLWKLKAALERTSLEMERTMGVTGPQRFLLRFVGLVPGITQDTLAELLWVDGSHLQSDLEHLVAKKLLTELNGSPGYCLTSQGASVNAVLSGTVEQAISKASDEASPYERSAFRRMLDRVVDHLGPARQRPI